MTNETNNTVTVSPEVHGLVVAVRTLDKNLSAWRDARTDVAVRLIALVGAEPTFEKYESIRLQFCADWGGAPTAHNPAWSRAWGAMNEHLAAQSAETVAIPKSTSKEATKKQEQRAAYQAKVEAAAKTAKPADLAKRAAAGEKLAVDAMAFISKSARDAQDAKDKALHNAVRAELKNATAEQWREIARVLQINP